MKRTNVGVGVVLLGLGTALGGCGACEPDPSGHGEAAASASGAAPSAAAPHPSAPHTPPHPVRAACRNITVDGDVHSETDADASKSPLLLQGLAPTEGWIALAAGARLVDKDPRTARETAFRGPARVRACVGLVEESWVASGTFESAPGAGEGPGAEEWVATPLGVVRYTAAKLQIDVAPGSVAVAMTDGAAFLFTADDATAHPGDGGAPGPLEDGWLRLGGSVKVRASSPGSLPLDQARAAAARCQTLGKTAGDLAATVMAGGADASTVVEQVATRRLARAACAVASLRVAALPASASTGPLQKVVAEGSAAFAGAAPGRE